jgi:hypothetical protein
MHQLRGVCLFGRLLFHLLANTAVVRTVVCECSSVRSVTSCVGGAVFICMLYLLACPFSTVLFFTLLLIITHGKWPGMGHRVCCSALLLGSMTMIS